MPNMQGRGGRGHGYLIRPGAHAEAWLTYLPRADFERC
jgi:hypothetical protein